MSTINVSKQKFGAFRQAVSDAKRGDVIIYYIGLNCRTATHRLTALGAYQAGLVLLVQSRLSHDGIFSYRAIRTAKPFHPFREAQDDEI